MPVAKIAIGTDGDVLTMKEGAVTWEEPASEFGDGWLKLFEGNQTQGGRSQIDFELATGTAAAGFLAAQRDTTGLGPYRQFMFQLAWNIGEDTGEELVQAQALIPGVPLGGSVAQENQGVRYIGTLAGLSATCPAILKITTTDASVLGNGSCEPDWGNRGSQGNPNVFWKLWGKR